jgi:hypothetical protein
MAKARAKHRRGGMTIPVAVLAGFAPLGLGLMSAAKRGLSGDMAGASQEVVIRTTGYNMDNKTWNGGIFMQSYGPIVAGLLVHKLAGRLGVNRALGRAGVPFLRV